MINILKSQDEYYELLKRNDQFFQNEKLDFKQIAQFIDEVRLFWLERLPIIEFELENVTKNSVCFFLSGAIYLGTNPAEYYYFKSLGNYHLISDSFLRIDGFFRIPEDGESNESQKEYFRRVYLDTKNILENYRNQFYILPIRDIAIVDQKNHSRMLKEIFLNVISDAFDKVFETEEDFCSEFTNFDDIERNMKPHVKVALIFDQEYDQNRPLKEKIMNYFNNQMGGSFLIKNKSESELFLLASFAWISQIIEILMICVILRLNPYIRLNITFNYLIVFKDVFSENEELKEIIENAILFYFVTKTVPKDILVNTDFNEYCDFILANKLFDSLKDEFKNRNISIFDIDLALIRKVITEKFKFLYDK
ncbi:hypothetical protein [Leptospira santarosai]|uniref:hypothetical protein n=1 Tax=Leptospira santarosai TaxID=28183 RepID=UPI0002BFFBA3|nr:hypothetical protein [Leptospira santarosai]EMO83104.1 hypothetical protein LEP1GSC070_2239 [Leptospira santarosai str. AIM]